MGQFEIHLAQSVATERHATTVRDAEQRRLDRERTTVDGSARPASVFARLALWLHPVAHGSTVR